MAHHKRKGPKSARAGCLLCKPHKRQGAPLRHRERFRQHARRHAGDDDVLGAGHQPPR